MKQDGISNDSNVQIGEALASESGDEFLNRTWKTCRDHRDHLEIIIDLMEGPMGKGGESFWTAIISHMADGVNLFPVETSSLG